MPRITPFEIIETPQYTCVTFKTKVNHDEMIETVQFAVELVEKFVDDNDLGPLDTPYLSIPEADEENFEIEIGVPVLRDFDENEQIKKGYIVEGKKIMTYYMGDNSLMQAMYDELFLLVRKNDYTIIDNVYEYYLNGPEYGKNHLLTKVMVPIK